MVHFVIAGKLLCAKMLPVLTAAHYLKNNLPSFEFTKYEFSMDAWAEYIIKMNREFHWHHSESPLIYKEVYCYGTRKPILIGGISEFWEYCSDYYGLECILSKEEIENLIQDRKAEHAKQSDAAKREASEVLTIMIYGASNHMTGILLPMLMMNEKIKSKVKVNFLLYDEALEMNKAHFDEFIEGTNESFTGKLEFCENLGNGLKRSNLLIFLDDASKFTTLDKDSQMLYLVQITFLAEEINLCATSGLKIIFANNGPSCLLANILARKAKIPHSHIVVVASDLGLAYLSEVAQCVDMNVEDFGAPPVWGSLGLNEFVDAGSALIKSSILKPFKRAVRSTPMSTLTQGTMFNELRFVNYLSDSIKDLDETVQARRKTMNEKLGRPPVYAKVEALINLMEIWFGQGQGELKEPIISLGVYSDGSYNIPQDLIFAQPAIQFHDGWVPFGAYPVPEHVRSKIVEAAAEAEEQFRSFQTLMHADYNELVGAASSPVVLHSSPVSPVSPSFQSLALPPAKRDGNEGEGEPQTV